ncbi:hypothetical protein [Kribbella deserti]|uniref:DUF3093 domain-containing protein n=1 Tax=Kribbella deserti TaxID=1926257 RepID=A0ABV6QZX2_9ACTN
MRFVDDANAVPWPRRGPVANLLVYGALLLTIAVSPILAFIAYFDDWGRLAVTVSIAMTVGISGYYTIAWIGISREQQRAKRLAETGIRASAEVVASHWGIVNEQRGAVLTLRITGPGIEPFQTVHRTEAKPGQEIGDRLPVLVDPTDHTTFAIIT